MPSRLARPTSTRRSGSRSTPRGSSRSRGPIRGRSSSAPPASIISASANLFVARVVTQFPPVAPSAPVLEASSDSGLSQTDGITNVTTPVFDVNTAGASNTVELLRNGVVVAQRLGPGAIQDPGPLADGTYTYTAVQVSSPFGLASPASPGSSVTILTVPPSALPAPTLFASDDSGTQGDGITNVKQPRLAVVANGGLTVEIVNAANAVIGSAYQASTGTIVIPLNQALADGRLSAPGDGRRHRRATSAPPEWPSR